MGYSGYEWLWLFFAYSFSGWVLETVTAAVRQKRFVNRGLVNGPLCVIYGITGSALMLVCRDLRGIWLFLGSMIFSTLAEWIAGHVIEKMYHERWWDYSHVKWNLDGYICFPVSVIWGVLGFVTMRWGAPLLIDVFRMIPMTPAHLVIWILSAVIDSHKDHRIAMTFAVAALAAEGETEIHDADCVNISYPSFYEKLERLTE